MARPGFLLETPETKEMRVRDKKYPRLKSGKEKIRAPLPPHPLTRTRQVGVERIPDAAENPCWNPSPVDEDSKEEISQQPTDVNSLP